jgi:acetylornithine aminotransferase
MAVELSEPVATYAAAAALEAGFILNAVAPDAIRLAPPLILTMDEADSFVAALPQILDDSREA